MSQENGHKSNSEILSLSGAVREVVQAEMAYEELCLRTGDPLDSDLERRDESPIHQLMSRHSQLMEVVKANMKQNNDFDPSEHLGVMQDIRNWVGNQFNRADKETVSSEPNDAGVADLLDRADDLLG